MHLLVPRDYQHKKPQLLQLQTASVASISVAAAGTGIALVPIYYTYSASALGSVTIFAGTAGSTLIYISGAAGGAVEGHYWDYKVTPNKALVLENQGTPGNGFLNVWYVAVRLGAGTSGLTL